MYQIIAPSLFQNKICRLPGIGTLKMVAHSAETDFVNTSIKSPAETIDFIAESKGENVFNEFSAMSEILLQKLNQEGSYLLDGIGTFTKDMDGKINFAAVSIDPVFIPAVTAERVIRQDASHAILVGDQHTTNHQMTEYYSEQAPANNRWWVWALILAAVGIAALLLYFARNGLQVLGNVS